jgi:hypothetical protein
MSLIMPTFYLIYDRIDLFLCSHPDLFEKHKDNRLDIIVLCYKLHLLKPGYRLQKKKESLDISFDIFDDILCLYLRFVQSFGLV